jgi:hypothetical protein
VHAILAPGVLSVAAAAAPPHDAAEVTLMGAARPVVVFVLVELLVAVLTESNVS